MIVIATLVRFSTHFYILTFLQDSATDKALKVMDKIIYGEKVSVREAVAARKAIVSGGQDLRRPLNFR